MGTWLFGGIGYPPVDEWQSGFEVSYDDLESHQLYPLCDLWILLDDSVRDIGAAARQQWQVTSTMGNDEQLNDAMWSTPMAEVPDELGVMHSPTEHRWMRMSDIGAQVVNPLEVAGPSYCQFGGNRPGGRANALAWPDGGGGMWLFGGSAERNVVELGTKSGNGTALSTEWYGDLWRLNPGELSWSYNKYQQRDELTFFSDDVDGDHHEKWQDVNPKPGTDDWPSVRQGATRFVRLEAETRRWETTALLNVVSQYGGRSSVPNMNYDQPVVVDKTSSSAFVFGGVGMSTWENNQVDSLFKVHEFTDQDHGVRDQVDTRGDLWQFDVA